MTLQTTTIPDDPDILPLWLEGRLMAPDFRRFLAELLAFFPSTPDVSPPHKLFNQWMPMALAEGLGSLPVEVLSQLLKHPAALAAFQERIVVDGGSYWDDVADRSDDLAEAFDQGKRAIEQVFAADRPMPNTKSVSKAAAETPVATPKVPQGRGARGYKAWAMVSTGIAACLAVAVGLLLVHEMGERPVPKAQVAWGWGKPGGLAQNQSNPKDYLNKLADNAEEWSQYQPGDPAGLSTRIAELRIGCGQLMHSSYGPLMPDDKAWLLEHCRTWAKMMDAHQQALDNGAAPHEVRTQVDETVRTIATTLRDKAKQVG